MVKTLVESEPAWECCKGPTHIGDLSMQLDILEKATGEFGKTILTSQAKELRGKYGVEFLVVNLGKFLDLETMIAEVEKRCKRLVGMKDAANASL